MEKIYTRSVLHISPWWSKVKLWLTQRLLATLGCWLAGCDGTRPGGVFLVIKSRISWRIEEGAPDLHTGLFCCLFMYKFFCVLFYLFLFFSLHHLHAGYCFDFTFHAGFYGACKKKVSLHTFHSFLPSRDWQSLRCTHHRNIATL